MIFGALGFCALISLIWGKKTAQAWANGIYNFCLWSAVIIGILIWYAMDWLAHLPNPPTPPSALSAPAPVAQTLAPAPAYNPTGEWKLRRGRRTGYIIFHSDGGLESAGRQRIGQWRWNGRGTDVGVSLTGKRPRVGKFRNPDTLAFRRVVAHRTGK